MFPDCAGEVDVVSDAENIKKLLKLPYTKNGCISMTVHNVGNTLLLDEFDISRYIMGNKQEWAWMRNLVAQFSREHRNIRLNDKSAEACRIRNLFSKFLYHSLKYKIEEAYVGANKPLPRPTPALPNMEPVLPEPKIAENMPDPESQHNFNRNVLWTFEDIRMLIGTDMPIFGGPNRPCISLRLRDMKEPINVLTGLDYWLDNLMCNVPEVLMCYHLDGIVQKYELIKTEDLPYLENSQFSPQVVRNVAHNILAFLKVNATKAGHTYWLFKGINDDVVKLYDLTTVCQADKAEASNAQQEKKSSAESPFTVPVGMLLYTVARNMKNCVLRISPKRAGTIRSLLMNCINLLHREKYPQIVTSSHYILADLYLPAGIDPKDPVFEVIEDDNDAWDEELYENEAFGEQNDSTKMWNQATDGSFKNAAKASTSLSATVKEFDEKARDYLRAHTKGPAPIIESIEERCLLSLHHIHTAMECLQFFNESEEAYLRESEERAKQEEKLRIIHEEQNPNMAKSANPIPLPYTKLEKENVSQPEKPKKEKTNEQTTNEESPRLTLRNIFDLLTDEAQLELQLEKIRQIQREKQQRVVCKFNTQQFGSWNVHLRLLLLEKACLTFATMAEYHYIARSFGYALHYIHMAIRCQHVINKYMINEACHKGLLLARAGDCIFQMTTNWKYIAKYLKDYDDQLGEEKCILKQIEVDLDDERKFKA